MTTPANLNHESAFFMQCLETRCYNDFMGVEYLTDHLQVTECNRASAADNNQFRRYCKRIQVGGIRNGPSKSNIDI